MIEVFAKALHATLYLITPWQYPPRLGIRLGLACYSISCHALPVSAYSAEAWHAIHLLRLGILFYILSSLGSICHCPRLGILFYILSRLGNICWGLALENFYSISYHALAVFAKAWLPWHSILYLITPWQYLPRLGMLFDLITPWQYLLRLGILFYILSLLGSIRQRTNLQKPKFQKFKLKLKEQSLTSPGSKNPSYEAQVEQTETCRRAGVRDEIPCENAEEVVDLQVAEDTRLSSEANCKQFLPIFLQK